MKEEKKTPYQAAMENHEKMQKLQREFMEEELRNYGGECYCVCHTPFSSRPACEHCEGDNEVGRYLKTNQATPQDNVVKEEWEETCTMKAGEVQPEALVVPVNIVSILLDKTRQEAIAGERKKYKEILRYAREVCTRMAKDGGDDRMIEAIMDLDTALKALTPESK